jgi:hypothetical protein
MRPLAIVFAAVLVFGTAVDPADANRKHKHRRATAFEIRVKAKKPRPETLADRSSSSVPVPKAKPKATGCRASFLFGAPLSVCNPTVGCNLCQDVIVCQYVPSSPTDPPPRPPYPVVCTQP